MANRTAAEIFGIFFELLAKNPSDEHKEMAKELLSHSSNYDFNEYQMYVDDELVTLGLARKTTDDNGYENYIYYGDGEY